MLLSSEGKLLVHWWSQTPNFGDLLAPWLARKISGREVEFAERGTPGYVTIGSILGHVSDESIVWGAGSFGTENAKKLPKKAQYLATRGPLTRNKLSINKIKSPRIYGDPALLIPDYYRPKIEKTHEVGIVLRWSESSRNENFNVPGVKKIYLGTDDIEGTIDAFLSCRRIISSSLHGLILADAYGIPNAWLHTNTTKGRDFKFYDYLISVDKVRAPHEYRIVQDGLTMNDLINDLHFDERPMSLDLDPLRDCCPFRF